MNEYPNRASLVYRIDIEWACDPDEAGVVSFIIAEKNVKVNHS